MGQLCNRTLNNTIEKILNNKPWFEYGSDSVIRFIKNPYRNFTSEQTKGYGYRLAQEINKQINNGPKKIGNVAYTAIEGINTVVKIAPSANQIKLLNELDEDLIKQHESEVLKEQAERDYILRQKQANEYIVDGEVMPTPTDTPFEIMSNDVLFYRDFEDYDQQYSFIEDSSNVASELADNTAGINGLLKNLLSILSNKFGVEYEFITPEQAKEVLSLRKQTYNNEKAFFVGDKVYFVGSNITQDIAFHEFAHPLVRSIKLQNSVLFENLFFELSQTAEGKQLIEAVKSLYPEYSEEDAIFKEEVIVRALQAKFDPEKFTPKYKSFIDNLLYAIRQLFRRLFTERISIEKLNVNTTISELFQLIQNSDFTIDKDLLNTEDVAGFIRESREEILKELNKIESSDLIKISNNFFDVINRQQKTISKSKYKDLRMALRDKLDRSDLTEILSNLRFFSTVNTPEFKSESEEIEYYKRQAEALLNSLLRLEVTVDRLIDHFKILSRDMNDKEKLSKIYYYNQVLSQWEKFIQEVESVIDEERYSDSFKSDNPLYALINSISKKLKKTEKYRDAVYKEASEQMLTEQLSQMTENIDKYYMDLLAFKRKRGAPQKEIESLEAEYKELRLSPEKIKNLLEGNLEDAAGISSFIEGYMYNQDPVIFGFAQYVKDNYSEMIATVQNKMSEFFNKIEPLVKKAGYGSATSRLSMGRDLTSIDKRFYNKNTNTFKELITFLNPWKDYKGSVKKLEDDVEKARDEYYKTRTEDAKNAYSNALKKLNNHNRAHMHQDYHDDYYKMYEIFEDTVGKLAYLAQQEILSKIQGLHTTSNSIDDILENRELEKAYWREYKLLGSDYNTDGSLKQDNPETNNYALSIARKIQEYRKQSRKFYTYKQKPGAFDAAYLRFLQSLEDQKIEKDSEEYDLKKREWLKNNTVMVLNDEFYKEKARILNEISELSKDNKNEEIIELYKKITNLISAYKDENGQPIGSQMNEDLRKEIKKAEEEIINIRKKLRITNALTESEQEIYHELNTLYKAGAKLTEDELDTLFDMFSKIKESAKSGENNERIGELIEELFDLQSRMPTTDYVDTINDFLTPEMIEYLETNYGFKYFTASNVDVLQDADFAENLISMNPLFEKWYNANHIYSEYKKKKKLIRKYRPSRAWSYIVSLNEDYYEKTEIRDSEGNLIDEIVGKPDRSYFYREVKDSYVNDNGETVKLKTERITILDCIQQGIPIEMATIDMHGKWLPKPGNGPYKNDKYFTLKTTEPDKYKLLLSLIESHLSYQKDLPYSSRLDLEIPRYRMGNYEIGLSALKKENPLSRWAKQLRAAFTRQPDDLDRDLNPNEKMMVVNADLFDEDYIKIPITGMFDLEIDQTSYDVMGGMMRYMQSGVKQSKLLEMLPTAKALQSVVNNPDNNPDKYVKGMKLFRKAKMVASDLISPVKQKGLSIRAKAVNNFIEREFEGKQLTGLIQNGFFPKLTGQLQKAAGHAFFSFNIPSALKNSLGLRFQSLIESAGGNNFNFIDYTKGSAWAQSATMEISHQIYKLGSKSLKVQLVELMDPLQGRLFTKISESTGSARSLFSDVADFKFLTNVRKWTELNSTLSVFGALLNKEKIKRDIGNGKTELITYDEAWEVVDGVIRLKSGIDPEYNINGKKYKAFVRKVHNTVNSLAGAYSSFDSPEANRYLLYRMIMSMKTYFMRMFMNRFAYSHITNAAFSPRYNAYTDGLSLGYYTEAYNSMRMAVLTKGKNLQSLTTEQKVAWKKVISEVALLYLLKSILVEIIFGFNPDDDDKYEKLRRKSGALPGPFVSEDVEHPFKVGGWLENHALYLAMLVRSENEAWIPSPGYGLDDYANILSIQSIPLKATLIDWSKAIGYALDSMSDDPAAYYKREVGPYDFQQEGGSKFLNYLMKNLFTMSGTTIDPVTGITKQQSILTKR
jgi:hypothetical protein